jgi:hypothetical protein
LGHSLLSGTIGRNTNNGLDITDVYPNADRRLVVSVPPAGRPSPARSCRDSSRTR